MKRVFIGLWVIFLWVSSNAAERPNILFILTDDQSPMNWEVEEGDPVGPCGFGFEGFDVYTPEIDRLAKTGIYFERAYASSTVCCPSRYSYLTGRYAGRSEGKTFKKLQICAV